MNLDADDLKNLEKNFSERREKFIRRTFLIGVPVAIFLAVLFCQKLSYQRFFLIFCVCYLGVVIWNTFTLSEDRDLPNPEKAVLGIGGLAYVWALIAWSAGEADLATHIGYCAIWTIAAYMVQIVIDELGSPWFSYLYATGLFAALLMLVIEVDSTYLWSIDSKAILYSYGQCLIISAIGVKVVFEMIRRC